MMRDFEAGISGGMPFVNSHEVIANYPGKADYDPETLISLTPVDVNEYLVHPSVTHEFTDAEF